MIVVKAESDTNVSLRKLSQNGIGPSRERIRMAMLTFNHASEMVDAVISGMVSLDAAYRTAQGRKADAEERETRIEGMTQALSNLANYTNGEYRT